MHYFDKPKDECGVAGAYVFDKKINAAEVVYQILLGEQNRGDLSAGVCRHSPSEEGIKLKRTVGIGSVEHVFGKGSTYKHSEFLASHESKVCIGHVRYATSGTTKPLGSMTLEEKMNYSEEVMMKAQPAHRPHHRNWKNFAFAFNGTISNFDELRDKLAGEESNYHFPTNTDTEIKLIYITRELKKYSRALEVEDYVDVFKSLAKEFDGAWTMTMIDGNGTLVMARDPYGFKPAVYGKGDGYIVMGSESAALRNAGADFIDLEPGHMIIAKDKKLHGPFQFAEAKRRALCLFEFVYFARPTSFIDGINVQKARMRLGSALAENEMLNDLERFFVAPIPKTPIPMVDGYQKTMFEKNGVFMPQLNVFIPSPVSSSRSFLSDTNRTAILDGKLDSTHSLAEGLRGMIIDDSLVRGHTSERRLKTLREFAGASEVHLRIGSAPIKYPCFYGINFPTLEELMAARDSLEKIRVNIGADSLQYLEVDKMVDAVVQESCLSAGDMCTACWTGDYPTECGHRSYEKAKAEFEKKK